MSVSLPTTRKLLASSYACYLAVLGSRMGVVIRADGGEMIRMCWQLSKLN